MTHVTDDRNPVTTMIPDEPPKTGVLLAEGLEEVIPVDVASDRNGARPGRTDVPIRRSRSGRRSHRTARPA